jgi:hypothetical protein
VSSLLTWSGKLARLNLNVVWLPLVLFLLLRPPLFLFPRSRPLLPLIFFVAAAVTIVVATPVAVPAAAVSVSVSTAAIVVVQPVAVVVVLVMLLAHYLAHLHLLYHQRLLIDYLVLVVHGGFGFLVVPIHFVGHLLVGVILRVDLSLRLCSAHSILMTETHGDTELGKLVLDPCLLPLPLECICKC